MGAATAGRLVSRTRAPASQPAAGQPAYSPPGPPAQEKATRRARPLARARASALRAAGHCTPPAQPHRDSTISAGRAPRPRWNRRRPAVPGSTAPWLFVSVRCLPLAAKPCANGLSRQEARFCAAPPNMHEKPHKRPWDVFSIPGPWNGPFFIWFPCPRTQGYAPRSRKLHNGCKNPCHIRLFG